MSPISISQLVLLATLLISTSTSVTAMPIDTVDMVELEERQGVSCYPMQLEQLKKRTDYLVASDSSSFSMLLVPAWNKVVEYARDTWGEGGGPTLNPPEYADRGADACMDEPRIKIEWAQQPSCSSIKTLGEGMTKGADATISFVQKTGSEQSGSWTVTSAYTYYLFLRSRIKLSKLI
ncbi:hypothetical protein EST38_g5382 [Candolleomyces aberdarensis]|uniref:Uncharacterized protein n=1 Tax=Candolleomyces aberdarensis TaxID=2316362 RepID=A0A4Q2DME9_9AGAR|nr:hypothetical protein EST38_g5382 [Candolleomyces aberdarensis]